VVRGAGRHLVFDDGLARAFAVIDMMLHTTASGLRGTDTETHRRRHLEDRPTSVKRREVKTTEPVVCCFDLLGMGRRRASGRLNPMIIRPVDIADDRALAAAYEVERAANLQARPVWVGRSREARILGWRANEGWTKRLLGAWGGETLHGWATCMTSHDAADTTWIFIWVHPEHQGNGIGSALMRAAESACPPSTERFVTSAYRPTVDDIAALETHFLNPLGFSVAMTETVVDLDLLSAELVQVPVVEGYTLSTYLNGVPVRFREQIGQIKGPVDAEAPNGELGWSKTAVTPEEYANEIDLDRARLHGHRVNRRGSPW